MIGIILAAGNGSRLKHSTRENLCKPLLEINQKPLIWYSLENCLLLGIDRVCVVVGKEGEAIMCIIPRRKVYDMCEMIQEVDPTAFWTISEVNEIYGRGFSFERRA